MAKKILWRILISLGLIAIMLLSLWRFSHTAEIPSPLAEVKDTMQKLKAIIGDSALKSEAKKQEKRDLIRKLILERIDVAEMGRRSLGPPWNKLTLEEKTEYLDVFEKYIEAFYRERIFYSVEFINSTDIQYLKERIDGNFAEIDVKIIAPNNTTFLNIFRLHLAEGHWKAYDVVIEGVSQVLNQRSQFARIIAKGSFRGLLQSLREATQRIEAPT